VVRRTCLDMYVVYPTRASLSIHTCKFENWVGIRENIRSYEQINSLFVWLVADDWC
jgi:hypothetical protein